MKIPFYAAAIALVAAFAAPHGAAAQSQAKVPAIERAAISLDGQMLALVYSDGVDRTIAIEHASDKQVVAVIHVGAIKLRGLQWVGSNHLIFTSLVEGQLAGGSRVLLGGSDENLVAFDYDVADQKQTFLMNDVPHALNVIYGAPIPRIIDGKPYAYVVGQVFADTGEGQFGLFRANLDTHTTALVEMAPLHAGNWVVDAEGRPVAVGAYDAAKSIWTLRLRDGNDWRVVKTVTAPINHPAINGLGRDGRSVLISDTVDQQRVLRELEPDAQDWSAPFAASPAEVIHDPATYALIGYADLVGADVQYTFFDPKDAAIWRGIQAAYPGQKVTMASESGDHREWVVRVDSPTDGPAFALVDLNAKSADWIGAAVGAP